MKRKIGIFLLLLSFLMGISACPKKNETVKTIPEIKDPTMRTTSQGTLTGVIQDNGSYAWLGIPFAKPPVGELRWKAPRKPTAWDGVFPAIQESMSSVQFVSTLTSGYKDEDGDGLVGSEDCLYLKVYAPSGTTPETRLPVMYWIHGGGNNSGSMLSYNGGNLSETQKVVVVTVQYRLGAMGWFFHPALVDENAGKEDRSGNYAVLDMIYGLEWVRDNIAQFGGDAANVTIFGESAGGADVMALMLSPRAKGLFHKAICESGGVGTTPMYMASNFKDDDPPGHPFSSKEIINKILIRDGKANNREEAKALQLTMTDTEIKDLLYAQDSTSFLKLYNPKAQRNYPSPKMFEDGLVQPDMPAIEAFASGKYNQVPLILGTNRDERRIYMYSDPKWRKIFATKPSAYIQYAKYGTDAWKLRGVDSLVRTLQPVQAGAVYAYRFDWDEEAVVNGADIGILIGAGHTTEIPFVFGDWDASLVPAAYMFPEEGKPYRDGLSKSMMSYWTQMAYTGAPGKGRDEKEVEWLPWTTGKGEPKMIIFDTTRDGGIRMSDYEITADKLKREFMNDKTFDDQETLCNAYVETFLRSGLFDRDEYLSLGKEGCADYPVERY